MVISISNGNNLYPPPWISLVRRWHRFSYKWPFELLGFVTSQSVGTGSEILAFQTPAILAPSAVNITTVPATYSMPFILRRPFVIYEALTE